MHCMGYCPEKAVEASHPLAVLLSYACTFSLSGAIAAWLIRTSPGAAVWADRLLNPWLRLTLQYAYILIAFASVYALFSWLVRIPLVNRLFTCFTLTHYYRRYRAPDMTGKENADNDRF